MNGSLARYETQTCSLALGNFVSFSGCWLLVFGCFFFVLTGCQPPSGGAQKPFPIHSKIFDHVEVIGTRGVGVGQLNKPRSVAIDAHDNLFVVDMTGRVQKFSSNGVFLLSWQMPQTDLGKPKGMCRDLEGNIIVVEPHYQRINHFTAEGKLVAQWGIRGTNEGHFVLPRAVAINSHNEIFISEYSIMERVQKFKWLGAETNSATPLTLAAPPAPPTLPATNDSSAAAQTNKRHLCVQFELAFGQSGQGPKDFNRPEGLCVDAHDNLYVADSCNHRIQVYSSDGKLLRSHGHAGSSPGEFSYPYDICVDKEGRQYVAEFGNSRIQVFDANDHPIEIIGGPGGEPGQFSNPWGVALDSAGNLYVADSQNHRVQKFVRKSHPLARASSKAAEDSRTLRPDRSRSCRGNEAADSLRNASIAGQPPRYLGSYSGWPFLSCLSIGAGLDVGCWMLNVSTGRSAPTFLAAART